MSRDQTNSNLHPLDNEPPAGQSADNPPPSPATAPRLSIMHLLVGTATSAVMMAANNLLISLQPEVVRSSDDEIINSPFGMAMRTVWAMAAGASVGGLLLLVTRRWKRQAFPVQPGEWLLVTTGCGVVLNLAINLLMTRLRGIIDGSLTGFALFYSMRLVVDVAKFLVPALLCQDNRAWRRFFWTATVVAFLSMSMVLGFMFLEFYFRIRQPAFVRVILLGVGTLTFLIAIAGDLRRRTKRGWVHWTGLVALMLLFLSNEGWYIFFRYFYR